MTLNSAQLVGAVIADLVSQELRSASEHEPYPKVRVVGASVTELQQMLNDLSDTKLPDCDDPVRVFVAGAELSPLTPAGSHQEILGADETLTAKRHLQERLGTVLVGVGVMPDAEGLQTLFTIGDQTALRSTGSDDATIESRVDRLTEVVWRLDDDIAEVPGVVKNAVDAIFDAYRHIEGAPSLRAWLGYLSAVRTATRDLNVIDEITADRVARSALASLYLFPDHADGPFSSSALHTRLRKNIYISRSSDPNGRWVDDIEVLARIDASEVSDVTKARMVAYVAGDRGAREQTSFEDWLRVFESKASKSKGLGTRIRDYVETRNPTVLDVLEALDVVEALNGGGDDAVSAAEDLVSAASTKAGDESNSLYSSLPKSLRKQVDRLLSSSDTVSDPLIGILRRLTDLPANVASVAIEIVAQTDTTRFSRLAFVALYVPALRSVAEALQGNRTLDISGLPNLAEEHAVCAALCGITDEDHNADNSESGDAGWGEIGIRITLREADESVVADTHRCLGWTAIEHFCCACCSTRRPDQASPLPRLLTSSLMQPHPVRRCQEQTSCSN